MSTSAPTTAVNMSAEAVQSPEARSAFNDYEALAQVVIELTGRVEADDAEAVAQALEPARSRGARVAVDESGRGGTSLIALTALDPDFLKLERSLVAGFDTERALQKGASAAVALADHLGAAVVGRSRAAPRRPGGVESRKCHCLLSGDSPVPSRA